MYEVTAGYITGHKYSTDTNYLAEGWKQDGYP